MLTRDKDKNFYINGKRASENSGRCIDCAQPTIVVKGQGKEYRVGCICNDGIAWRDVPEQS